MLHGVGMGDRTGGEELEEDGRHEREAERQWGMIKKEQEER